MSNVIDPILLDLLICPESRQELSVAGEDLLRELNGAIDSGTIKSRGGDTLSKEIEGGLVREDGQVLYPVRDGIPIMLISESIQLPHKA